MNEKALTAEWIAGNMKLIHYILKKRNICASWYPDYEDKVQDIVCTLLKNKDKYKPEVASVGAYVELLVRQELGRPLSANAKLAGSSEQLLPWHDSILTTECAVDMQVYADRGYEKLTEIQKMEAEGYTFKEIGKAVGLSPDYIRNKKGLATRVKEQDK
jgi:hypothetical protein